MVHRFLRMPLNILTSIKDADRDAILDYAPRLFGNGSPRGSWRVARGRGEFPGLSVAERRFPLLVRRIVNGHVFCFILGLGRLYAEGLV